jgi:hypothetical protein
MEIAMGIRRRKVQHRLEALELFEALDRSGLKLTDFCAQHGIDGRSLNCWRQNLSKQECPTAEPLRLVEVVQSSSTPTTASYRVWVGDFTIEVDDNFNERTLARLLLVAASC